MAESKPKRSSFVSEQRGAKRKPKRKADALVKRVFSKRDFRNGIKTAAIKRLQIIINYTKTTTGEQGEYTVNPYSYRYRHTRNGVRKLLFAEDAVENKIKGFVMRMIGGVRITDVHYKPRWKVEIKRG